MGVTIGFPFHTFFTRPFHTLPFTLFSHDLFHTLPFTPSLSHPREVGYIVIQNNTPDPASAAISAK